MTGDVAIITLFYFAIFGIVGVEMFKGKLLKRCGYPDFSNASYMPGVDIRRSKVLYVSLGEFSSGIIRVYLSHLILYL